MKKIILIIVLIVALIAVGVYFLTRIDLKSVNDSLSRQYAVYSNSELGMEFRHPTGPDGYVIQETTPANTQGELIRTVTLIPSEDLLEDDRENGEGGPTITIHVLKNTKKEWSGVWADTHPLYSLINLKRSDITDTVIGGANAVRYMADGLYVSDVVVVANGDNVYVFQGMYLEEESDIRADYQPILDSLKFIPTPGQE